MSYWRLYFWWYADKVFQWPIDWTRRCLGPLARACGRRYIREFKRLEERGLLPIEE